MEGPRILVVEDEDALRGLFERFLNASGFAVQCARDGATALAAIEGDGAFAAAVVDITLPDMNGEELAGKLAQRVPGLKVLFVSGRPVKIAGEGQGFLQKPFRPAELADGLRRLLDAG